MLAPNPAMIAADPAPKFHDVTIVRRRETARACIEGVPPEEFGIARSSAGFHLNKLLELGAITRSGKTRSVRYSLSGRK